METGLLSIILAAGLTVKFVMLLLLLMSARSFAIILFKLKEFKRIEKQNASFTEFFHREKDLIQTSSITKNYPDSPAAHLFRSFHLEVTSSPHLYDNTELLRQKGVSIMERILKKNIAASQAVMENTLSFLATTGNTAPFVGLFGTVWGIMNSFRGIGETGSASLAVVAPGIAEALIATAMGLFAAIPAVIAYNYFIARSDKTTKELENFSEELLIITEKGEALGDL